MSTESICAIKDFESYVRYKKESTIITVHVRAEARGAEIYNENTECRFYYEAGYAQQVVEINWNVSDTTMKALGLHSRYTTNFQEMVFEDDSLVIHAGDYSIYLTAA